MNTKEKIGIPENPICTIHTVGIITNDIVQVKSERALQCISRERSEIDDETGVVEYRAAINPNKLYDRFICSHYDFEQAMSEIMTEIGVQDYRLTRADFALDYFEDNYDAMHKINKCICLLMAQALNLKNRYEATDPLTLQHLTTRVQSEYFECENYNKDIESYSLSPVYNRLELRSKAILKVKKDIPTLMGDWCNRLDYLPGFYDTLQGRCNNALVQQWYIEDGKRVKSMPEFLRKYQDNVYTNHQLTALYSQLGFEKPQDRMKNFKRYNSIECISEQDLKKYIEILKNSMNTYLDGSAEGVFIALKR